MEEIISRKNRKKLEEFAVFCKERNLYVKFRPNGTYEVMLLSGE